ncbi:MAG TPA: MFS transporter [Stellaceae bacterium]|nr:MFS transporter [Stellaceae bacterium]
MNEARLPLSRALAYAAPGFALAIPLVPVFTFLPTLYARDVGLGLAGTGTVLFVARAVDFLLDPLIGLGSDRIETRFGRRKPWIVVGAIIAGAALFALFAPPAGAGAAYLFLWLALLYLGFTAVQIPYTAWGAELVPDYHERTRITGLREGLTLAGIVTTGALPVAATLMGLSERRGMVAIALLAILCGGPAIALLAWRVPEGRVRENERVGRVDLRAMLANRPFLRLFCAWFVNGLATGVPAVLFPFYLQYGLIAGQMARGVMIFTYFAAGACAIPAWLVASRRFGKHRVWCCAMLMAMAAFVWVPLLQPGADAAFFVVCLVTGAALGADLALPPAMQADVVDLDNLRTGAARAGFYFAIWGMGTKLALGAAAGGAFYALDLVGFDPNGGNGPRALFALAATYALAPVALKSVAVALVWNFPVTPRRHAIIRRRLAEREALSARSRAVPAGNRARMAGDGRASA